MDDLLLYLQGSGSRSYASFISSEKLEDVKDQFPKVEVIRNPPEWKFVERILPSQTVPAPKPKTEYPSGWKPQTIDPKSTPYFINRTRNHMLPVYLHSKYRGMRQLTLIRRIQGDIWALEKEIVEMLKHRTGHMIVTRINEMNGQIYIKGDYVNMVADYLMEKGF